MSDECSKKHECTEIEIVFRAKVIDVVLDHLEFWDLGLTRRCTSINHEPRALE